MNGTRYYTIKEAAAFLRYSPAHVYYLIREQGLKAYKPAKGKILIAEKDLIDFIERGAENGERD